MAKHIYYLPGRQVGRKKWIVNLLRANGPRAVYKVKDKTRAAKGDGTLADISALPRL